MTRWNETGSPATVPADYGNAYQFLLYLDDRYGPAVLTALHRDAARHGLDAVAAALADVGETDLPGVLRDYQRSVLLDGLIDAGAGVVGIDPARVSSASVTSTVNLDNPAINTMPGVPVNGADYVPLAGVNEDGTPTVLGGVALQSLVFHGAPAPAAGWSVVADDPDRPGNPVLSATPGTPARFEITVPADDPTLRMLARTGIGTVTVTVSTDGGVTSVPVAATATTDGPTGPAPTAAAGFQPVAFDLSPWAGQPVQLDISWNGAADGLRLDDIFVGAVLLADGTTPPAVGPGADSPWSVTLVGLSTTPDATEVTVVTPAPTTDLEWTATELADLATAGRVVAIVGYADPADALVGPVPYTLTVNGVLQAGGAAIG